MSGIQKLDKAAYGGSPGMPCSPSYSKCERCGEDCNLLGQDEGQCWGRVDLEDYAESGEAIHACRGHQNYWEWCNGADVRKYIPEND